MCGRCTAELATSARSSVRTTESADAAAGRWRPTEWLNTAAPRSLKGNGAPPGLLSSGCDDLDGHRRGHVCVQTDRHLVLAEGLDRLTDLDLPLVDLRRAGLLDRVGDLGGRDGTEQTARLAGLGRHDDRLAL